MIEYIYIRQKHLSLDEDETNPYDYGYFLKLRKDPQEIYKIFGPKEKFVSTNGRMGLNSEDNEYIYDGKIKPLESKIPLNLRENFESVFGEFLEDLKQNISVRLSK